MKNMKQIFTAILLSVITITLYGQGAGIGYQLELGGSNFQQPGTDYDQAYYSTLHNAFLRIHNCSGNNALQFMLGYRIDSVSFHNRSEFLAADGVTMSRYNTSAFLKRDAIRFSVVNQMQLGHPGRIVLAINTGLFTEHTLFAARYGRNNYLSYELDNEINHNMLGGILGFEIRLACFTLAYKYEKLFGDILNHDYILNQEPSLNNSSELRGLVLNPPMHYVCLGINLDFFHKHK
jgi:hypothetical protein